MRLRYEVRFALPLLAAGLALSGSRAGLAAVERASIPADTVVHVKLDANVSSRSAVVGDRVKATVIPEDHSGFPVGTRVEGRITEVQHASKEEPGILDMRFDRVVLPDATAVPIDGRLASLSDEDTRRDRDGRVVSRSYDGKGKFETKWVGYGAGGGAVLATIFGGSFLKGALLGGLGGAVYSYLNKDRAKGNGGYREVELGSGTEFGVRLNETAAFDRRSTYRYAANDRYDSDRDRDRAGNGGASRDQERVAGSRSEYRYSSTAVTYGGRRVDFGDTRPMNVNGTLYVPLSVVARAANLDYRHRAGDDFFSFTSPDGMVEGTAGETRVSQRGHPDITLRNAPMAVDGEIYVPVEFFSQAAGMHANWDRRAMRLELEPYR